MRRGAVVLLLAALVACTADPDARPPERSIAPEPAPPASPEPPPRAMLRLVAADEPGLLSYVDGIRFAADEVNARGTLELQILQAPSVEAAVGLAPAAVLVVGDHGAIASSRPAIEEARMPVVAVGGDLYSDRQLFRYAFQTAVPIRWQARVLASYVIEDRGHTATTFVAAPDWTSATAASFPQAWTEEGGSISEGGPVFEELDSVIHVGSVIEAAELSEQLSALEDPPQLAVSSESLDAAFASSGPPRPGTVTCYPYAWSGWADMLPRIHDFRERFHAAYGRYPAGLEQEGYDAVMALAEALERTGGEGGDRLVAELETFREETYSSLPIRLGPDDHVFAEESHLGLFAVTDPAGAGAGEAFGEVPWRPIMRTFTTDGEKVNLWDPDKRVFFSFWHRKRPTPKYRRSPYGIVTRPREDPLH